MDVQKLIFDFTQDSYYAEIKNSEMISFRIDLLSNMTDYVGKYYSNKWIMTNLLKFTEDEVNAMKKEITAEKKDSQGLCFIGKVKLPDFLQQKLKPKKGKIIKISLDNNKHLKHDINDLSYENLYKIYKLIINNQSN